jgi:hypothetical protein
MKKVQELGGTVTDIDPARLVNHAPVAPGQIATDPIYKTVVAASFPAAVPKV